MELSLSSSVICSVQLIQLPKQRGIRCVVENQQRVSPKPKRLGPELDIAVSAARHSNRMPAGYGIAHERLQRRGIERLGAYGPFEAIVQNQHPSRIIEQRNRQREMLNQIAHGGVGQPRDIVLSRLHGSPRFLASSSFTPAPTPHRDAFRQVLNANAFSRNNATHDRTASAS